MTSLPPDAAGRDDREDADRPGGPTGATLHTPPASPLRPPSQPAGATPLPPPSARPPGPGPAPPPARPAPPPRPANRPSSSVRASNALVELTLDLRFTPPDKVIPRLFGALERVGEDVTLLVLLRDTPEYAGVLASAYQALRAQGYASDSSRVPPGGQRLRVQRRRDQPALRPGSRSEPHLAPPLSGSRLDSPSPEPVPSSEPVYAPIPDSSADGSESPESAPESPEAEPPQADPPALEGPLQGQP